LLLIEKINAFHFKFQFQPQNYGSLPSFTIFKLLNWTNIYKLKIFNCNLKIMVAREFHNRWALPKILLIKVKRLYILQWR